MLGFIRCVKGLGLSHRQRNSFLDFYSGKIAQPVLPRMDESGAEGLEVWRPMRGLL